MLRFLVCLIQPLPLLAYEHPIPFSYTMCPINYTRPNLRHTAYHEFPAMSIFKSVFWLIAAGATSPAVCKGVIERKVWVCSLTAVAVLFARWKCMSVSAQAQLYPVIHRMHRSTCRNILFVQIYTKKVSK